MLPASVCCERRFKGKLYILHDLGFLFYLYFFYVSAHLTHKIATWVQLYATLWLRRRRNDVDVVATFCGCWYFCAIPSGPHRCNNDVAHNVQTTSIQRLNSCCLTLNRRFFNFVCLLGLLNQLVCTFYNGKQERISLSVLGKGANNSGNER